MEDRHNEEFADWFEEHVRKLKGVSKPLQDVSKKPGWRVYKWEACNVNGTLFRTIKAENKKRIKILASWLSYVWTTLKLKLKYTGF